MHETVLTVFTVTAMLGLVSLLLPLAERFSIPYSVLLALVGIAIGAATHIPAALPAWRRGSRHHRDVAQFRAQRRVPSLHLLAGAAVRCSAQRRRPAARRRGRPRAAARGCRRPRLHPCRRFGAVADRPRRGARLHHPRRDHRHHRPGCGRRDLSRHRGAAPPVDPGAGREPVQRRGGDRDLFAYRRDPDRGAARASRRRCADFYPPVRRRERRRLCDRVAYCSVDAGAAVEPACRGDADDRLCLRDLHHLRPLPACLGRRRGRRGGARGQRRGAAPAGPVELRKSCDDLGAAGVLGKLADLFVRGDAHPGIAGARDVARPGACSGR